MHAGPFGNIAHANNSIIEDRIALKLADYVVTEAGFASDLGFQKFCDIVCRIGGFAPSAAVLVTTRARDQVARRHAVQGPRRHEDLDALRKGVDNLTAHIQIVRQYGLPCVVAINSFPTDTAGGNRAGARAGDRRPARKRSSRTTGSAEGGEGAVELAEAVVAACEQAEHVRAA